jgi:hypothetical protein
MVAVTAAVVPTLSQVRSWQIAHLTTAADHWISNATIWESAFSEVFYGMPNPGGAPWLGLAADAAQERAYRDRMTIIGVADELHAAALVARSGATQLEFAKRQVLSAVSDARAAGFTVDEDLSVSSPPSGNSAALVGTRLSQAQQFASHIRSAAVTLATLDQEVAGKISAAATGVSMLTLPDAPPSEPTPADPKDPDAKGLLVHDADGVHKIVDPLPSGRQPHVKVLPNPETVRGLFDVLTRDSAPAPPSNYPGESRVLEDGTRISYREGSKSGGPTIDLVYPDQTQVKIHVEDLPKPPTLRRYRYRRLYRHRSLFQLLNCRTPR